MQRREMDSRGVAIMIALSLLFGFNQVSIKIVNVGFNPVLAAGLRSLIALACVLAWMRWRGVVLTAPRATWPVGLAMGACFGLEFCLIYLSLDYTTVTRSTVMLYTMPVWLAIAAHFLLPGERITLLKAVGLALAFGGVVLAMFDQGSVPEGRVTLPGDLLALGGALGWAAVAFTARKAGARGVGPYMQLVWMVAVSAPLLMLAAPLFGELVRAPGVLSVGGLVFQGVIVVAAGFLIWFFMLATYPASSVASFSFLSPILGLLLGWGLLGEPLGWGLALAGGLVAAGLVLINWPRRA